MNGLTKITSIYTIGKVANESYKAAKKIEINNFKKISDIQIVLLLIENQNNLNTNIKEMIMCLENTNEEYIDLKKKFLKKETERDENGQVDVSKNQMKIDHSSQISILDNLIQCNNNNIEELKREKDYLNNIRIMTPGHMYEDQKILKEKKFINVREIKLFFAWCGKFNVIRNKLIKDHEDQLEFFKKVFPNTFLSQYQLK